MNVTLYPSALTGTANAIGSKSDLHRVMICAALADRPTKILGMVPSDDVEATAACLAELGADVQWNGAECVITPGKPVGKPRLDCCESGSTLRFLLPVSAAVCDGVHFTGSGRLPQRPIGALAFAMESGGVSFSAECLPFEISGRLRAGKYILPGNISSQYISGLLMALSCVPGESVVQLSTDLESASYVDMTLHTLRMFGAEITAEQGAYRVCGQQTLTSPGTIQADGDWSNAAFFLVSGAIGGKVCLHGLREDSLQGDRKVVEILRQFGANVRSEEGTITVWPGTLCGCKTDLTDIPDLLPALAVAAAFSDGVTEFTGGARLRLKESDRLQTVCRMICSLGGCAKELPDGLRITGSKLSGGVVDGAGDHRIVMAAAIAAAHCTQKVEIIGAQAVNKSYPDFWRDFSSLGGQVYGI